MKKIFDVDKNKIFFFHNLLTEVIKKNNYKFNGKLDQLHNYFTNKEINQIRLKCFKKINSVDWARKIKEICGDQMFYLLGQDLLIQSKINLSIQLPGDKGSILDIHSDCWSADTPFQLNLWIPLTNAYSTNSMFIMDDKYSLKFFKKIIKNKEKKIDLIKKPSKQNFINIKYGKVLIFNPSVLHGNVLNKTKTTRVSLNVRFKSIFAPEPSIKNSDRKFGTYYKKFNLLDSTKFALNILKTQRL